jgi:hypothetical protein
MNLSRQALAVSLIAIAVSTIAMGADAPRTAPRGTVARRAVRGQVETKATAVSSYSVEVPYIQSYTPPNGGQTGTLVLNAAHSFNISVVATDQHHNNVTGNGVSLPQTDTFGYFSLPTITSNPSNPEIFVKILDGRTINGSYWVFYGHLTDLIYDITVKENATGTTKTYHKDAGNQPGGFDTEAFPAAALTTPAPKATRVISPNSFLRTSVDIANNTTTDGVNAILQYCYTTGGAFQGCTPQRTLSLAHMDVFHQDDIVSYLGSVGDLSPSAVQDSVGTLLVTFTGLPSQLGWEGTVSASTYNRVSEVDPLRGTVGCGVAESLFFQSATASLVGTAHDTVPAPSAQAGAIASTLGVHNTDALGTGDNVTVDVSVYDPSSGQKVGNTVTLSDIAPGELRLVDDLYSAAAVPTSVTSAIVFVDTHNSSPTSATVEGFILDQDTDSLDTRYHELQCVSGCS